MELKCNVGLQIFKSAHLWHGKLHADYIHDAGSSAWTDPPVPGPAV